MSYDNTVSDDTEAGQVFASKRTEAHLPEPVPTDTTSPTPSHSPSAGTDENAGDDTEKAGKKSGRTDDEASDEVSDDTSSSPSDDSAPDAELQPRALEGLADEAFLDDQLTARASAGGHRTVTVVFRTSNVIVTVEYEQQPGPAAKVPDSKEMQDRARELARKLAGTLGG